MDHEYSAFVTRAKRVIPIILDKEGPSRLPQALTRFQWVDFTDAFEPALRNLLDGIAIFAWANLCPPRGACR